MADIMVDVLFLFWNCGVTVHALQQSIAAERVIHARRSEAQVRKTQDSRRGLVRAPATGKPRHPATGRHRRRRVHHIDRWEGRPHRRVHGAGTVAVQMRIKSRKERTPLHVMGRRGHVGRCVVHAGGDGGGAGVGWRRGGGLNFQHMLDGGENVAVMLAYDQFQETARLGGEELGEYV